MRHIPVADSIISRCSGKQPAGRNSWDLGEWRNSSNDFSSCVGAHGLENHRYAIVSSNDKDRSIVTQYSISNEIKAIRITPYFNKSSSKFASVLCGISLEDWNKFELVWK